MDLINEAINLLKAVLSLPNEILKTLNFINPPVSSLFIFCVSVSVTIFSVTVSRRFMDVDKLRRFNMEMKRHNALKMKALRGTDSKAIKKYELEKDDMRKIQNEMMSMRLKPMMFTIIPVMIVFSLMNGFYGSAVPGPNANTGAIAAVLPFPVPSIPILLNPGKNGLISLIIFPLGWNVKDAVTGAFLYFQMSYIGWYFTISISVGAVIQKLAGLTP
ncbi:MAG: EMC3/TMCO1 family protein [Candidatus Odinarchaeota archaeon]